MTYDLRDVNTLLCNREEVESNKIFLKQFILSQLLIFRITGEKYLFISGNMKECV